MAPSVPEALKKKRVAHQAALAKRALAQQNAKKANVIKRRAIIKVRHHKDPRNSFYQSLFKRAAAYAKEYENKERLLITRKRQAKANGNAYVDGEPKLALVIRIRGINQISPRVKKILQLLRLRQIGKFFQNVTLICYHKMLP